MTDVGKAGFAGNAKPDCRAETAAFIYLHGGGILARRRDREYLSIIASWQKQ